MIFWSQLWARGITKGQRTKRKRALQKAAHFDTELKAEFLNEIEKHRSSNHNNGNR